jgi:hypothetical protein
MLERLIRIEGKVDRIDENLDRIDGDLQTMQDDLVSIGADFSSIKVDLGWLKWIMGLGFVAIVSTGIYFAICQNALADQISELIRQIAK